MLSKLINTVLNNEDDSHFLLNYHIQAMVNSSCKLNLTVNDLKRQLIYFIIFVKKKTFFSTKN